MALLAVGVLHGGRRGRGLGVRHALLEGHGVLPDVLHAARAAQLLGEESLQLGPLDGAQQDHGL